MKTPLLDVGRATYQGTRRYQEDAFFDSPVLAGAPWFGVVSDGMGGHRGGDVASRIAVSACRDIFNRATNEFRRNVEESLRLCVEGAHTAVVEKAFELGFSGDMGATVVAFAIDRSHLYWCSSGDSRLYLIRSNRVKQLTKDFTLGAELETAVQSGRLTHQEIDVNQNRGALTSFLGADALRLDVGTVRLVAGDWLLACTDGLYGTVGEDALLEVVERMGQHTAGSAEMAIDMLFRDYLFPVQKPNQDNATAILCKYGSVQTTKWNGAGRSVRLSAITLALSAIGLIAVGVAARNPLEVGAQRMLEFLATKPSGPAKSTAPDAKSGGPHTPETAPPQASGSTGQAKLTEQKPAPETKAKSESRIEIAWSEPRQKTPPVALASIVERLRTVETEIKNRNFDKAEETLRRIKEDIAPWDKKARPSKSEKKQLTELHKKTVDLQSKIKADKPNISIAKPESQRAGEGGGGSPPDDIANASPDQTQTVAVGGGGADSKPATVTVPITGGGKSVPVKGQDATPAQFPEGKLNASNGSASPEATAADGRSSRGSDSKSDPSKTPILKSLENQPRD